MDIEKFTDKFLEFEYKHNCFAYNYNGFNYWIYIRYMLSNHILKLLSPNDFGSIEIVKLTKLQKMRLFSSRLLNAVFHNPLYECRKNELLIVQHQRKYLIDEVYQDIYTNFLITQFQNANVLDTSDNGIYKKPQIRKFLNDDYSILKRILYNKLYHFPLSFISQIEDLQKSIEKEFKVILGTGYLKNMIFVSYTYYKSIKPFLYKLLKKMGTKFIIETVYYGQRNEILNEIASELGITTIELQHGTIGRTHIAYNFIEKNTMPQFPDFLLTFSDYWKYTARFPIDASNIISVGFPHFEKEKSKNPKQKSNKIVILFISQTTIGCELSKIATKLNQLIDLEKFKIIYRLHPSESFEWRKRMPWLAKSGIEVIENFQNSIYSQFSIASIQIGVYSTALYEGLGFGLNTMIVKLPGYERLNSLVEKGYATLVTDENQIYQKLKLECIRRFNIINDLWVNNSEDKALKVINKILYYS